MRFRAVHKLMSYLLATAAVVTLITSGAVPAPTLTLLIIVGVLSWFVEPGTRMGRLLDRAVLVFNVVALAFFGVSVFRVIDSFPEPDFTPVLNLILFLLGYKLFHRRNNRDYLQLYILSFLLVLAAAWLAQTVLFVVGFGAYVILATWTLILFHLRREIEDNYLVKHLPESGTEKVTAARVLNSRRVVGSSFFVSTALVALAVLVGATVVFALVPRIGLGFLTGGFRRRVNIVGFSDEVTLGHHGLISGDNRTVVLWVRMPRLTAMDDDEARDRTISEFYWRGTVYDTYSNGQWLRSRNKTHETRLEEFPTTDGTRLWWVGSPEAPAQVRKARPQRFLANYDEQEIQVIGLSHPVAFALDEPMAFVTPPAATGSFVSTEIQPRFSGEVALRLVRMFDRDRMLPLKDFNGARYFAYSRNPMNRPPLGQGLPLGDLRRSGQLDAYLTVPSSLSPKVAELAQQITREQPTAMGKAIAIVDWLRKTHGYTTDLKRDPRVADPLEDFLFHQKAGHCEYFASASAVLLRLAGIPSRYVNGFLGGEWNDIGKSITVRDNRAHSWAEAYVGAAGWVRVDATPMQGVSSRMGRLYQLFDSVEFYWSRWVIDYDASRQIELARRIGGGLGGESASLQGSLWRRISGKWLFGGAAALVVLIVLRKRLRFQWVRRTLGSALRLKAREGAVFRAYDEALSRLSKRGWTRRTAETPREFARRVRAAGIQGADALGELTELYAAARFGERAIPEDVIARLDERLQLLAQAKPAPEAEGAGKAPPPESGQPRKAA